MESYLPPRCFGTNMFRSVQRMNPGQHSFGLFFLFAFIFPVLIFSLSRKHVCSKFKTKYAYFFLYKHRMSDRQFKSKPLEQNDPYEQNFSPYFQKVTKKQVTEHKNFLGIHSQMKLFVEMEKHKRGEFPQIFFCLFTCFCYFLKFGIK